MVLHPVVARQILGLGQRPEIIFIHTDGNCIPQGAHTRLEMFAGQRSSYRWSNSFQRRQRLRFQLIDVVSIPIVDQWSNFSGFEIKHSTRRRRQG